LANFTKLAAETGFNTNGDSLNSSGSNFLFFPDTKMISGIGPPIAKMLKRHSIPFAITTAYCDENSLPDLLKGIPIGTKSILNRFCLI
jgi:hypothetical protein